MDTGIINNPWVIGIGGGIISSLIVFFVTQYISRKRGKREYIQKIEIANNDILYFIRPLIIDKKIPTMEIISAIRFSTAKKYGIKEEDLYNETSLYNDLVTEIMANSFLSAEQKLEFCDLLKQMKSSSYNMNKNIELMYLVGKGNFSTKFSSMLLAFTSFLMVLTSTLLAATNFDISTLELSDDSIIILMCIATSIPILVSVISIVYKDLYRFKSKRLNTKDRTSKTES